jgi:hypothetical protein
MYLISPNYIVKEKNAGLLHVETNSGRSWFLTFVILISLFQEMYVTGLSILLCFIVWTYKREWLIKISTNELTSRSTILWMVFDETTLKINEVVEIWMKKVANGIGAGFAYIVYIKAVDGESVRVATRGRCVDLKPIINDFRIMLPETIKFTPHEDYFKGEKFIRFD